MAKFLQEHLAPKAQEIDHSNEFKNLRVSGEAQAGGQAGIWAECAARKGLHSLLVNKASLGLQPLYLKCLGLIVPATYVTGCLLTTHSTLLRSVGRSFGSSWGTWEYWASRPPVSIVCFPKKNFSRKGKES